MCIRLFYSILNSQIFKFIRNKIVIEKTIFVYVDDFTIRVELAPLQFPESITWVHWHFIILPVTSFGVNAPVAFSITHVAGGLAAVQEIGLRFYRATCFLKQILQVYFGTLLLSYLADDIHNRSSCFLSHSCSFVCS